MPPDGEEVLVQRQWQVRLGLVWPLRTCRVCGLSFLSHERLDGSCALEGMMWTQYAGGWGARGRGGDPA